MIKYSVRRLLQSLVTIFLIISAVFLLLRLMPESGYFDPTTWQTASDETKMNVLQHVGVRDEDGNKIHPIVQLITYFGNVFTKFDFGISYRYWVGEPVTKILSDKIPVSLGFGIASTILVLILGYAVGVLMARFKDKWFDRIALGYIVVMQAAPITVTYVILQRYITLWLKSPMLYRRSEMITWIAPVVVLAVVGMVGNALWIRRYMVDQLNSDYVKLAYAKGLSGKKVMFKHVLRNAVVPMCYGLPGAFILSVAGSILLEPIFAIPGMGPILIRAVQERENNLVQCIVFLYTVLSVLSIYLGDVLAAAADPRIRLTGEGVSR